MRYGMPLVFAVLAATGCHYNAPPATQMMHPGPGVDGPGPGVMMLGGAGGPASAAGMGGMATQASCYEDLGGGMGGGMLGAESQVAFVGPEGMIVNWDVSGHGMFDSEPLICPARYNFGQGAIYRFKLSTVPARPGLELYPTLEVGPATPRTAAFLSHNAIPVQFTEEDFDQVTTGNFVTKVIYLPDADYQQLAVAGVETLVSTRLDPGVDPIVEADRRGSILAIMRLGNKDLAVATGYDGEIVGDEIIPASYGGGGYPGGPIPSGGPMPMAVPGGAAPPGTFVSGVNGPQYGMPISGTPIGLPGPPHVPLGGPAGLKKHSITNWTKVHMPKPVKRFNIHAKHSPGIKYPSAPRNMFIHEKNKFGPFSAFRRPASDRVEHLH